MKHLDDQPSKFNGASNSETVSSIKEQVERAVYDSHAAVAAQRSRSWDAGFRPVEVYNYDSPETSAPGKAPKGNDWRARALLNPPDAAVRTPDRRALNTGILNDVLRAAARVGISRAKLYQEMAAKRLAYFKVGRRRLITEEALRRYIDDRQRESA